MNGSYPARHQALLRAVAEGRGMLSDQRHPNLSVDGLWCDQLAVFDLVRDDLIRPGGPVAPCGRVPAALTERGVAVLAGTPSTTAVAQVVRETVPTRTATVTPIGAARSVRTRSFAAA